MGIGITAIISAFNEEDIIGQVIADFARQDIGVYLIDNGSTDATAAEAGAFAGRGLLHLERFPEEQGGEARPGRFLWEQILRRKQQLAESLDGDWFFHTDADELRESPWPGQTLREGVETCDRLGYNALDFSVLNFFPTRDGFRKGDDLREFFTHYEPGAQFDRAQVKAWKRQSEPIDLASSGGHDVAFAGRRVCPVRFLLRHYPIRSQAHGERKVFVERRPRFVEAEQRRGWHVQYAQYREGHQFVRDPATLTRFDGDAIRRRAMVRHRSEDLLEQAQHDLRAYEAEEARLSAENQQLTQTAIERHRRAEELERENQRLEQDVSARERLLQLLQADTDARRRELDELQNTHRLLAGEAEVLRAIAQREHDARTAQLERAYDSRLEQLERLHDARAAQLERARAAAAAEAAELRAALGDAQGRVDQILGSRTWRWSAAARETWRLLGKK